MNATRNHSILVIDDDRRLTAMLSELLETEGYDCTVAPNGSHGLLLLEEHRPDIVVLDVMMPGQDGIATLVELRRRSRVPVIMLTALGQEEERIRGLEAGADDYVTKPFSARELLLRIRAVLARSAAGGEADADSRVRRAGSIEVRLDQQRATIGDAALELTGTELRILALLVDKAGAVVTRQQLSRYAIGRELLPDDRTLDTHVSNLRRKIAAADGEPMHAIRAIRGSGYRLTLA